jgi:hypothetical protein
MVFTEQERVYGYVILFATDLDLAAYNRTKDTGASGAIT